MVSAMTDNELELLLNNPNIIRNRLKIFATRQNAKIVLNIQEKFGSFDQYIWHFVDNKTIVNKPQKFKDIVARSKE